LAWSFAGWPEWNMRDSNLREWRKLVRGRAHRDWRELSSDVVDELACHLADLHAAALAGGASDAEARARALEALNDASLFELSRRPRARRLPGGYLHDVRLAVRQLRASPIVSLAAVLSLALGIGTNTAMFSILNSLLLRTLPVAHPEQLAIVRSAGQATSWTNPIWEGIRGQSDRFAGAMAWAATRFDLAGGGEAHPVPGLWVSGSFFDVLRAPMVLGRALTPDDDRRGGGRDGPVAVIGYGFWRRQFGGARDVIGRRLSLNRVSYTIAGVTVPGFFGPDVGGSFDVIVPLGTEPLVEGRASQLDERSSWWLNIMIRLKADQSPAAAEAALNALRPILRETTMPPGVGARFAGQYMIDPFTLAPAATGRSPLRARYQQPLLTILAVVGLVLLVACANIANLQLARATARRHEISLRMALGASPWQIARQFLIESALLATIGAAAGQLFARWAGALIVSQISTDTAPVFLDLSLDWHVLAFTTGITAVTTLLFGAAPALHATRAEPAETLAERGPGGGGPRGRLTGALVVTQVAVSLLLVVAAGLFVRTFVRLAQVPLGFQPDGVLIVSATAPRNHFEAAQLPGLQARLLDAVRAVPGAVHAALSSKTPAGTGNWTDRAEVPGMAAMADDDRRVWMNSLSSGWFATYGTPILSGRDFTDHDTAGTQRIALVNQAFARKFTGGKNPVGRTVRIGGSYLAAPAIEFEIVGLAGDAVYRSLRDPVPPTVYIPNAQRGAPMNTAYIGVRTAGDPMRLARSIESAIAAVDGNVVLTFRPLEDQVGANLVQERLVAMIAGFFGGLALLLAALGLYGLTSYNVACRRTEIGIRMTLGAAPSGVVALVLSRVAALVAAGIVIGAVASVWAAQFVAGLLYQIEPHDPSTIVGAAATLAAVGAVASALPAYRASRIDPAAVLRDA
jgi:putative ABC transport system permease protein